MQRGSPVSVDGRSLRRLETRRRLLEATQRIVARRGEIEAVPIEEIAQEAGVSTGSFHNHFGSKEELFEAAVSEAARQYAARTERRLEGIEDPAESVAAGIRLAVRLVREDPLWGAVAVRTRAFLGSLWWALRDLLEADLRRGIAARRFSSRGVATLLHVVGGATYGVMMGTLAGELPARADRQLAHQVLCMLGLPETEARRVASLPLPAAMPSGPVGRSTQEARRG